jgi:ParB family transcriptional regulator, chromosome partitioning protein
MHIDVPLNRLKFGQEDGAGINARVAGRLDGIEALAANIFANGQIEDLIIKKFDDQFYSVSNGNRRLAAFHQIYGKDSETPIGCTLHDVDNKKAFEYSLTTAVTVQQLHPVDRYEGFAYLRDEEGKTEEEIARQYGLTEKEVRQALALGRLSPKIRDAWRKDEVRAETAQAFTLAKDHKAQDRIFAKLAKDAELNAHSVRTELGVKSNAHLADLIAFVTPDFYRECGGKITEDLFGEFHSISDETLVNTLATDKLDRACNDLIAAGWAWAKPLEDLPKGAQHWTQKAVADKDMVWHEGEKERRAALDKKRTVMENESAAWDYEEKQLLEKQIDDLDRVARGRSFTDLQKSKLGCILDIEEGALEIIYGVVKPAEQLPVKRGASASDDAGADDEPAGKAVAAPKEATTISNAMADRLGTQLLHATKDALLATVAEPAASPIRCVLAGIVADQIRPEQKFHIPPSVSNKLAALRAALPAAAVNAALAKRFDAKDYFGGAPKVIVLKAVKEAVNADEARKLTGSTKAEIGKFALANVVKTGWLPKELRTPHYAGPGSDGYKKPSGVTPAPAKPKPAKPSPAKKTAKKSATAA